MINMNAKQLGFIKKGYEVVLEDDDEIVFSKKSRVIPWPICLLLGLVFLPLVLLVFWKHEDIKVVSK